MQFEARFLKVLNKLIGCLVQEGRGDGITVEAERVGHGIILCEEFAPHPVSSLFEIFSPARLSQAGMPAAAAERDQEQQEERNYNTPAHILIIIQFLLHAIPNLEKSFTDWRNLFGF